MNRMTRLARWAGALSLVSISLAAGFAGGFTAAASRQHEALQSTDLLREALGLVGRNHFNPLPDSLHLQRGMIRGLIGALDDPFASYQSPAEDELESQTLQGAYGGIGALLQPIEDGFVLIPYQDGPAWRAGVLEGDRLLQIDSLRLAVDQPLSEISAALRGEPGSRVSLRIARGPDQSERTFEIEREVIPLPSVTAYHHPQVSGIGVLTVTNFSQSTPSELQRALAALTEDGVGAWILDLRNNPGGLLDSAIATADLFLEDGQILSERSKEGVITEHRAHPSENDWLAPMIVLMNGGTASAAEVVAGALGDNQRAPLIGEPTYGKGSVQSIYGLSDGSNLHITTARWFTPAGLALDGDGLVPDVLVAPDPEQADAIMAAAVAWLIDTGALP